MPYIFLKTALKFWKVLSKNAKSWFCKSLSIILENKRGILIGPSLFFEVRAPFSKTAVALYIFLQRFKNNPLNCEFRWPETLKCFYFAVFENLFAGLNSTKCDTFYSILLQLNDSIIACKNITYFHSSCHFWK